MAKPNKPSVAWQTLSDAESESLTGGLLLPAVQAAREAAKRRSSINSKSVGELDRIKAGPF